MNNYEGMLAFTIDSQQSPGGDGVLSGRGTYQLLVIPFFAFLPTNILIIFAL